MLKIHWFFTFRVRLEDPGVIINYISCKEMKSLFVAIDEESEDDSDYNDDEDFAMEKKKTRGNKKETKQKRQGEKEKKTPTSKINITGKFLLGI